MFETPVVLTIFNRPALTARVLDVLRVVQPVNLFVIADAPRPGRTDDAVHCAATRALVDQIDWPCRAEKIYRTENLGVGLSIAQGIQWVLQQVDAAIFVEDDTLPHPSFFPFCAALLEQYRDDERVAMIQGTNVLGTWRADRSSYFFSRFAPLWGWAGWKRTWRDYDYTFQFLDQPDFAGRLANRLGDPIFTDYFIDLCARIRRGEVEAWDIQIMAQQILRGALCIVPSVNPIQNLGFGLDGSHTQQRFALGANLEQHAISFPLNAPSTVALDDEYDRQYMALTTGRPSLDHLRARVEQQFAAERYSAPLLWLSSALQRGVATTETEQAELRVLYARALYALGQRERAQTVLDLALDSAPDMQQALALRHTWQM